MQNPQVRFVDPDRALDTEHDRTLAMRQDAEPISGQADDYLVEGDTEVQPTPALRAVQGLQFLVVVVLAVLSFAVFWLVGVLLNIL
jgi:hypothetical protein